MNFNFIVEKNEEKEAAAAKKSKITWLYEILQEIKIPTIQQRPLRARAPRHPPTDYTSITKQLHTINKNKKFKENPQIPRWKWKQNHRLM